MGITQSGANENRGLRCGVRGVRRGNENEWKGAGIRNGRRSRSKRSILSDSWNKSAKDNGEPIGHESMMGKTGHTREKIHTEEKEKETDVAWQQM